MNPKFIVVMNVSLIEDKVLKVHEIIIFMVF